MTLFSKALTLFGAVLLAHACYSAQEHSSLLQQNIQSSSAAPASASSAAGASISSAATPNASTAFLRLANVALPADIILETLASVLIICLGLMLGSPTFLPISWHVWAGDVERRRRAPPSTKGRAGVSLLDAKSSDAAAAAMAANPFASLESRLGFWDVRARRKEFQDWVRQQEKGS